MSKHQEERDKAITILAYVIIGALVGPGILAVILFAGLWIYSLFT